MQPETFLDNCDIDKLIQVLAIYHFDFNFSSNLHLNSNLFILVNRAESGVAIRSRTEIKVLSHCMRQGHLLNATITDW